jgi:hypothetical protein
MWTTNAAWSSEGHERVGKDNRRGETKRKLGEVRDT